MSFESVRDHHLLNKLIKLCGGALVSLLMLLPESATAQTCSLTMGYRTNARPPLIDESPSNNGLYLELFSLAAKEIGCELKVERQSKKMVLKMMKEGEIDFYPGFNFTEKRAETNFFIDNGLPGGDMGVSRMDMPEITDLSQLKGKTLLAALGAADWSTGVDGLKVMSLSELTTKKAIFLIKKKRGDFYIYNKSSLDYFVKANQVNGIKLHPNCCGGTKPLYLGFSKNSPNYVEAPNPNFNPSVTLSPDNVPVSLSKDSVANKLQMALKAMKESGQTQALYEKYYQ